MATGKLEPHEDSDPNHVFMYKQDEYWPIRENRLKEKLCDFIRESKEGISPLVRVFQAEKGMLYEKRRSDAVKKSVMTDGFVGIDAPKDYEYLYDELVARLSEDLYTTSELMIVYVREQIWKPRCVNGHPTVVMRRFTMEYDAFYDSFASLSSSISGMSLTNGNSGGQRSAARPPILESSASSTSSHQGNGRYPERAGSRKRKFEYISMDLEDD
jgi:hypothetical protein